MAVAERQTLTGALERIADQCSGVSVPEVLYTHLDADVPGVLRDMVLAQLKGNGLLPATAICTSVVRLMSLQPSRHWLDP